LAPFDFLLAPFSLIAGASLLFRWRYSRTFALGFCIFYLSLHLYYFSLSFFFEGSVAAREELILTGYFLYFFLCILGLRDQKLLSFQTGRMVKGIRRGKKPYLLVTLISVIFIALGLVNTFLKNWFESMLFYAPEGYFMSSLMIVLGILLVAGWYYAKSFSLVFSWFYLIVSLTEFFTARYLIHLVIPALYFLLFTFMVMVLSSNSILALFSGIQEGSYDVQMLFDRTALRRAVSLFATWNLMIGFLDLIFGSTGEGASIGGFRDIFIRLIGFSLILASAVLFSFRKWARKSVIVLSALSLVYMLISLTWIPGGPDVFGWTVALAFLAHLPSIFLLTRPRVKALFV
jgi:hypothetical protein